MKDWRCKVCGGKLLKMINRLFDDRHGYPGYFAVYSCQNCGFGQTMPQLTQKLIESIYTNYYPRQNFDYNSVSLAAISVPSQLSVWWKGLEINCHWKTRRGERVLDVGSGLGLSLLEITKLGGKAYGVDPDKSAKKLARKFDLNVEIGTIEGSRFRRQSFDMVCASQVIEHVVDPVDFLKLCRGFIKPGGRIILSFPNFDSLTRRMLGRRWLHWHIPYHLNHFTRKSVEAIALRARLHIKRLKTVSPNAWSGYQLSYLMRAREMGIRDPFWEGGGDTKRRAAARILEELLDYLPANRLVDMLDLGEAFVAEFSI